nr:hypothetical protein [uncultured Acidocella sp.]
MPVATVPNAVFMQDWGVPVQFGALATLGILDEPTDELVGGMVVTTDYKLTYPTADLAGLDAQAAITVGGVAFTVRRVKTLSDGQFSEAILSKV